MRSKTYLKVIVSKTLQNGGTASKPATRQFLPIQDLWCFPKYPSKTAILPPNVNLIEEINSFISKNEKFLNEDDCWLGTWVHPITGEYYLDVSTGVENLEEARSIAFQAGKIEGREIVAIFNPKENRTVFLDQS